MSEGKKERKKRRLPFATGIKGYHCLDYYNGRTVRVVLYDQFGTPIPQSDTRYTRKNGESERDGFRFALTKAIKKVEAQRDAMMVFVSLRREYANSAVQLYHFHMMPYEALLLNRYITWLSTQNPGRTEPDRYLLSDDPEGREPMSTRGFHAFVRNLLMKVVVGYADRLGSTDLSKQKGAEFLKRTYRHRLEEYCGLTEQPDPDALTFLLHQSLAGHVQGDNYRCFTDPCGRERLLAYIYREQRFIPPRQKGQKQVLKSKDGDSDMLTFRNWDHQENRRIVLTFEAAADGEARFSAPYGALYRVEKLPSKQNDQNQTDVVNDESGTTMNQ